MPNKAAQGLGRMDKNNMKLVEPSPILASSMGYSTVETVNGTHMKNNRSMDINQMGKKFDFTRLVKSIMANPFQNTGMNV